MLKTDEDLEYVIGFYPDMDKVNAALKGVGDKAGAAGSGFGGGVMKMLGGLVGGQGGGGAMGQLGGMVGTAVGGPVGAVIGGVIGSGLGKAGELIGKAMGPILHPFDTLSGVLEGMSGKLGPVALVLPGFLKNTVGTLTDFAAKASPGTMMQFTRAVEDSQAVIGRTFVPVLESMRDGVRLFGDVLASILPDTSEVSAVLTTFKEAFGEFGSSVREAMGEFGPVIKTGFLVVIKMLGDAAAWAVRQLKPLVTWLGEFFRPIREMLGLSPEARSSVGAAAAPARFGAISDYQRQLQIAAFSGGATAASLPTTVGGIQRTIDEIYAWLRSVPEKLMEEAYQAFDGFVAMFTVRDMREAIDEGIERRARQHRDEEWGGIGEEAEW